MAYTILIGEGEGFLEGNKSNPLELLVDVESGRFVVGRGENRSETRLIGYRSVSSPQRRKINYHDDGEKVLPALTFAYSLGKKGFDADVERIQKLVGFSIVSLPDDIGEQEIGTRVVPFLDVILPSWSRIYVVNSSVPSSLH